MKADLWGDSKENALTAIANFPQKQGLISVFAISNNKPK